MTRKENITKIWQNTKKTFSVISKISNIVLALPIVWQILIYVFSIIAISLVFAYKWTMERLIQLIHSKIWSTPVILKVWQLLVLMIIISLLYLIINKLLKKHTERKKFVEFNGYNWRIENDIFDRIHIDSFPYCLKHNEQIIWNNDTARYVHCKECGKRIRFSEIQNMYNDLQKYVRQKFDLYYLPDIN